MLQVVGWRIFVEVGSAYIDKYWMHSVVEQLVVVVLFFERLAVVVPFFELRPLAVTQAFELLSAVGSNLSPNSSVELVLSNQLYSVGDHTV